MAKWGRNAGWQAWRWVPDPIWSKERTTPKSFPLTSRYTSKQVNDFYRADAHKGA